MYRGGDSVFRLSLIGIAFIFICFLLIAFGRTYTNLDVARTEALARLDQLQQKGSAPPLAQQRALESIQQELQDQLLEMGADTDPDKLIGELLDKSKLEAELATEKKRVQELGAQLAGLTEARRILTRASRNPVLDGASAEALVSALGLRARLEQEFLLMSDQNATRLTDSEITSRTLAAINFKRNIETMVERELGLPIMPGQEPAWEQWLLTDSILFKSTLNRLAANNAGNIPRAVGSNSTLHAQIDFLRARLETHNDKTAPPCWFDNSGRVQFLLSIELLRNGTVTARSAWPSAREASVQAIPGVKQLLAARPQTYANFRTRAREIAQHSGQQCRYSVQVTDRLNSGMQSERIHKELETLFHLVGLPR